MGREHNWSDTHTYVAERFHWPTSIDEVRRIVSAARQVRAIGARHSFNGIADCCGDIVDLSGLPQAFSLDRERMVVTAPANTLYGTLAAWLEMQGCALHNMASLPHITLIGAIATGTHGSGDRNPILAAGVAELELVTADADLVQVARGDDGFDGMVVGLGAFGVVTRVTLDVEPSFRMRQDAFTGLRWETLLTGFDAVLGAGYSVSVLTKWGGPVVDRLWVKTRLAEDDAAAVSMAHLGAEPGPVTTTTGGDPDQRFNPFGGMPGPWSERLPHFRGDRSVAPLEQIQSEYMLPRTQALAAIREVRAMADRIDPHLFASEIRSMAGDGLWLSPAHGHDTVALHFTWKREPEAVGALTRAVEDVLLPLGARPHWGKLLHADAARLAPLYPRMDAFRMLVRQWDPAGKFRNAWTNRHIFG